MPPVKYCGACGTLVRDECLNSFRKIGIIKVHWECWSDCNLPCQFCYRTLGSPLSTSQATSLISAVATGGAQTLVFAGGDPSIRPDINVLIRFAHEQGLRVEVQTNAHHTPEPFLDQLRGVEQVGLSLDGPTAVVHDTFRSKPGNFDRVLTVLHQLNQWKVPIIVRTVVAKSNHDSVHLIGPVLQKIENLVRWSLLEFSPVGEGYLNKESYELDRTHFRAAAERARAIFPWPSKIDIYEAEAKTGTYALITPTGDMYGTASAKSDGRFPTIGSILRDHTSVLSRRLPFSKELHLKRYSESLTGR